ncbi:MAG: type II toxin-antitoxin system VapC family toxin [Chloroflexi bacterium]|nr:type II toxin-antitoxin system VapC family toxin [Chloroflexota bacterium]
MTLFVVDASVVIKWFVPEIHSDAARRLLELPHEYAAPDLLFAEAANTIWKKVRRKELTTEDGQRLVADIDRIAVETVSCRALAEDAYALADAIGRTVYDSMYVTLAVRLDTRLLTADDRLEFALRQAPGLADHVQLVQTFEPEPRAAEDPETTSDDASVDPPT